MGCLTRGLTETHSSKVPPDWTQPYTRGEEEEGKEEEDDVAVVVVILNIYYVCNTLRPRQNGGQFTIIFTPIFWICLIQISLKFVPKVPINNIPALVQIMAWPGDKPPSEPIMVSLLTHIYVTRPQWVNPESYYQSHVFLSFVWTCQDSLIPLCDLEGHSTVLHQRSWD